MSLCLCGHPHKFLDLSNGQRVGPLAGPCPQCACTEFRAAGQGFEGVGPRALVGAEGCAQCEACPGHHHNPGCDGGDVVLTTEQACEYERGIGVSLGALPGRTRPGPVATVKAFAYEARTPADAAQLVALQSPVVSFVGAFNRRDWERLKRAVDRAFDAYESKWPTP